MEVVEQSWEIKEWTPNEIQVIEEVGRDAYQSHDNKKEGSAERFCRMLITRGHTAVLEFADARVRVLTNRAVSHELVRHRMASFLQESQRYVNYKGGMTFIKPFWADYSSGHHEAYKMWLENRQKNETDYAYMVAALGLKPEEARDDLPNATATLINMKHNMRGWREVFKLRTANGVYPATKDLLSCLLVEFHKRAPVLFQDLYNDLPDTYKS